MVDLLSVGIDIGTTTTQLIFSKIKMENTTGYFAVPRVCIVEKGKRQTSPRIKGRHLNELLPARWRSFIYEAHSILPGHLREAGFQPMLC